MKIFKIDQNKVSQNTFKNTHEDDLYTFCDIISHLTTKYRPDFFGLGKLLDRSGPDFDENYYRLYLSYK